MRLLIQRVKRAWVSFEDGSESPRSGPGLLALVGFHRSDQEALLEPMARKLVELRVFPDEAGRMNRSLLEAGGELVLVSQFTLYADCRGGRRPSFIEALEPRAAEVLYARFVRCCEAMARVVTPGRFGAMMDVHLVNDGPVTILLDSDGLGLAREPRGDPPAA
jgi:D-tyrosyl-tRNA(Tyr) deacylase